ncbi:hypothetical protein GYMLUDRAFT_237348 [Collybiopsis luxurians FD-317 M1]|nr:hypothetical protein GYMLUDRAFT_237348 [Collybiopsis luxurians FD-317 M1]
MTVDTRTSRYEREILQSLLGNGNNSCAWRFFVGNNNDANPLKRTHSPSPTPLRSPPSHSTPVSNNLISQAICTSSHYFRKQAYVQAADEMQGKYSKVSVDTILGYLPEKAGTPIPVYDTLKHLVQKTDENDMYEPFITAMTPYIKKGWTLVKTANNVDETSPAAKFFAGSDITPDVGLYSSDRQGEPITDSSEAELFGEFKGKLTDDPFPPNFPFNQPARARESRGQIALHINAIQATQNRTRVFSFFIIRNNCRLLCHSRAGTQYTDAFDYTESPSLHQFFWRFSHAKPSLRGHDTSLEPVDTEDEDTAAARRYLHLTSDTPLYRVKVDEKTFLLSRPFTLSHLFPVGRGTRCYLAYDPVAKYLRIIKDTWRNLAYEPEHKVYKELNDHKVSYVPGVVAAADVPGEFHKSPSVNGHVLRHYRLVLNKVGTPLTQFTSTHQLCRAVLCALQAHKEACDKANILHRDISIGNIIMCNDDGYLIDWERSKNRDSKETRSAKRTGTWQFLSIRIIENPSTVHDVRDDLESFAYVLCYTAVRYAPNNLEPSNRSYLLSLFDHDFAGASKRMLVNQTSLGFKLTTESFSDFLDDLVTSVSYLYKEDPTLRAEANRYGSSRKDQMESTISEWKERMLTHGWMESLLKNALNNPDWEQVTDGAVNHPLVDLDADAQSRSKQVKSELSEYREDVQAQRVSGDM